MSAEFEKKLCENGGKLITKDGVAEVEILDAEVDPLRCFFIEGCVEIYTKDVEYIKLTPENLTKLKRLIKKADAYYEKWFEENPEE